MTILITSYLYLHSLSILAPPSLPSIVEQPDDVIVVPGQSASFSCSADGEPPPTITWSLNNVTLSSSNQVSKIVNNHLLIIY